MCTITHMSAAFPIGPGRVPEWTLGDRLAKARRAAGLKQSELAEYLGISASAVGSYESDQHRPKLHCIRDWANRCDVHFSWLLLGDQPPGSDLCGPSTYR